MFWQALSERVPDQCACQDNSEDDKTNDQWILHDRVSRLEPQEDGGSTFPVKSAAEVVCS